MGSENDGLILFQRLLWVSIPRAVVFETVECARQHIPHHMHGEVVQHQSCQCCSQGARFNDNVSVHGSLR
jgi:hypothetical protein